MYGRRPETQQSTQESLDRAAAEFTAELSKGVPLEKLKLGSDQISTKHFPMKLSIEKSPEGDSASIRSEVTIGRAYYLFVMENSLKKTAQFLLQHQWTILHSPDGISWPTSDKPVVKLNYHSPNHYDFEGGWNSRGTEIFMPLSTRHLLYCRVGERHPQTRGTILPPNQASLIQKFIIKNAYRYIYAAKALEVIQTVRPRTVNARLYEEDRAAWARWHTEQSAVEAEYFSDANKRK